MTDLVFGMGEEGSNIFKLLESRGFDVSGYDDDEIKSRNYPPRQILPNTSGESMQIDYLHVCIPYTHNFVQTVNAYINEIKPKYTIIHSTVKPGTTKEIQSPVIYSPVRGVRSEFFEDLKRYTKYYASDDEIDHSDILKRFERVQWIEDTTILERTKILVDTTYYGWLIAYRKMVDNFGPVDWSFALEIHAKAGNRPVMYNDHKPIGGHCVLPNLELIDSNYLKEIMKEIIEKNDI